MWHLNRNEAKVISNNRGGNIRRSGEKERRKGKLYQSAYGNNNRSK